MFLLVSTAFPPGDNGGRNWSLVQCHLAQDTQSIRKHRNVSRNCIACVRYDFKNSWKILKYKSWLWVYISTTVRSFLWYAGNDSSSFLDFWNMCWGRWPRALQGPSSKIRSKEDGKNGGLSGSKKTTWLFKNVTKRPLSINTAGLIFFHSCKPLISNHFFRTHANGNGFCSSVGIERWSRDPGREFNSQPEALVLTLAFTLL